MPSPNEICAVETCTDDCAIQGRMPHCWQKGDKPEIIDARSMPEPHISDIIIQGVDASTLRMSDTRAEPTMYIYHGGERGGYTFREVHAQIRHALLRTTPFNRGAWQTLNVSESDQHDAHELRNVAIVYGVPQDPSALMRDVRPDMPWAEDHFQERIGGSPLNPAPSYRWWPYHNGNADRHVEDKAFSHTYPERFWPKFANEGTKRPNGRQVFVPHNGIRYEYGDLHDVVSQLNKNPFTRQAVLPVWFPEDTGATDYRVPCTLFYHFMNDGSNNLDCWYSMRSCDYTRHFHNDVYLAARLMQWICDQLAWREGEDDHIVPGKSMRPGRLNMTISNLHLFRGDVR